MSVDLNQSNVTLDKPLFNPLLTNLQANILKFHGRKFAHHLFIQFKTETIAEAKKWIIYFASSKLTNAYTQLYDAARHKSDPAHDGGTVYTLSLSNYGYKTLKIKSSIQQDKTFNDGMHASKDVLKDNFLDWEKKFQTTQMDMLIIVADDDPDIASDKAQKIIDDIAPFATCEINQRGNVLKMKDTSVGIEHFSYADGVSQPMYLEDEIKKQPSGRVWDDETNLDMVLVKEEDGIDNCFGSYFVFRKLEQRVKDFKEAEGDNRTDDVTLPDNALLPRVADINGDNTELPGAMIVGRYENSTPVTKSSVAFTPDPSAEKVSNDFNYADDKSGLKCPFHAHIRLVNPRNGNDAQDPKEIRSHRITRRGITFDDHPQPFDPTLPVDQRKRFDDTQITEITNEQLQLDNQPKDQVGLLFMCYQSNIQTHFEELQGQWANTGIIDPATTSIGEDSLITQGDDAARTLPKKWGEAAQSSPFSFSGFITNRGGEYFYTPSVSFLKNL